MVIVRKQLMLGDRLLKSGLLTQEQLEQALAEQKKSREKLGESIVRLGYMTVDQILPILAEHIGVTSVRIRVEDVDKELVESLPEDLMRKYNVFPVSKMGSKLTLAMADPLDVFAIDEVQLRTKSVVRPVLALKNEIEEAINSLEEAGIGDSSKANEILEELEGFGDTDLELVDEDAMEDLGESLGTESAPVITAVNALITKAIKVGASDIHIEPYEKFIRVRFRIDGVLSKIKTMPKKVMSAMVSRIKIMSDLDIAEKRLPQDGRFKIRLSGRDIDFRVSCLPTVHGEKIVMRILDKGNLNLNMRHLGFERDDLERFQKAIASPYGMVLVTGPTGSGKTTTLYSALHKTNTMGVNISTAEDPVEFRLEGVNQVHCRPAIGLDFSAALKSFLRQDPDIIMVGEIRDLETAEISIKAALTGHLVLATLHTNDAASTIQRMINMGVEPFMLSAALNLIEGQRLARKICESCKEEVMAEKAMFSALGLDFEKYEDKPFFRGRGCPACNETGYKGRIGIYEVMTITDELRADIAKGVNAFELKKRAIATGMKTLREDAIIKAEKGITSLEEVLRVTME